MKQLIQEAKFQYGKSFKMIYWGCQFDSLLELKYAISIQEEFEFLRNRVVIYYQHGTCKPTFYLREGVRHYTPDFLIRNKKTGEAYLIEIKPRAAQYDPQLIVRTAVAENYIKWKKYDWKFKIVYDDEILLDEAAVRIYEDCCKLKSKSAFKLYLYEQEKKYGIHSMTRFGKPPSERNIRFIFYGFVKS